ncbi:MAG: ATP-binding protein [Patescibacteria group bacterium]|jgi:predicted ATPase
MNQMTARQSDTHRPNSVLRQIVLIGGPCSGKSSVLRELGADLSGQLQCVPEAVTALVTQLGLKLPFAGLDEQKDFVTAARLAYQSFEAAGELQARSDGKQGLLLDCCVLTCAAYWPDTLEAFEKQYSVNIRQERLKYDGVIFLDVPSPDVFREACADNPARHHDYGESVAISNKLLRMWGDHPQFVRISAYPSWERKLETIRAAIRSFLTPKQ